MCVCVRAREFMWARVPNSETAAEIDRRKMLDSLDKATTSLMMLLLLIPLRGVAFLKETKFVSVKMPLYDDTLEQNGQHYFPY